jgi:hypothetical protein
MGTGVAIGHLNDIILKVIDIAVNKQKRQLEEKAMRIKNARDRFFAARKSLESSNQRLGKK